MPTAPLKVIRLFDKIDVDLVLRIEAQESILRNMEGLIKYVNLIPNIVERRKNKKTWYTVPEWNMIAASDIIELMISADMFNNEAIYSLLGQLETELQGAQQDFNSPWHTKRILPILLRPFGWKTNLLPLLADLSWLPQNGRPITQGQRDKRTAEVVAGIRIVVEELLRI